MAGKTAWATTTEPPRPMAVTWWLKKQWEHQNWVVVSNIFYFHPYLGKIPILTHIFQRGWNHQLEKKDGTLKMKMTIFFMILMLKFGCLIEIVSDLPGGFVKSRFSCLLFGTTLQARDHVGLLRGSLAQMNFSDCFRAMFGFHGLKGFGIALLNSTTVDVFVWTLLLCLFGEYNSNLQNMYTSEVEHGKLNKNSLQLGTFNPRLCTTSFQFPVSTFRGCDFPLQGLVTYLLQTLTDDHFERSFLHHWHRWWRRHRYKELQGDGFKMPRRI